MPEITGDFLHWSQQQLIQNFLQLNDPTNPFYVKAELQQLPIRQLKAYAQKAHQIYLAFQMQNKIEK